MKVRVSFQGPRKLGFALLGAVFAFLAALSQGAIAGDNGNIPEPSGTYAISVHGSLAVCLDSSFAAAACGGSGVTPYPFSIEEVGTITYASGVGCENDYQVAATQPSAIYGGPSSVTLTAHTVVKITAYDSTTGVGTASITGYTGGSCNGASFDSSGATESSSGTVQIVVVSKKRTEVLVTQDIGVPVSDIASVQISGTDLKQTE
jgi:hypothetical protein